MHRNKRTLSFKRSKLREEINPIWVQISLDTPKTTPIREFKRDGPNGRPSALTRPRPPPPRHKHMCMRIPGEFPASNGHFGALAVPRTGLIWHRKCAPIPPSLSQDSGRAPSLWCVFCGLRTLCSALATACTIWRPWLLSYGVLLPPQRCTQIHCKCHM